MIDTYKIAIISDIHSNFSALGAIFDELSTMNIDDIVIAGDHLCDGPDPNLCIDFIKSKKGKIIKGNREDYLISYHKGMHPDWIDSLQLEPLLWTYENLKKENFEYISNLPEQIVFEAVGISIRVVHGSPRRANELILKHQKELIEQALASVSEDILLCGHCHQMWHADVNNTLIINPGSAGLPFLDAGSAPYSVLVFDKGNINVEEHCARYDIRELILRFEKSKISDCIGWPKAVIASLKSSKIVTLEFLYYAKKIAVSQGWKDDGGLIPNQYWIEADKKFHWQKYGL
jgi:putative phosphoesterase